MNTSVVGEPTALVEMPAKAAAEFTATELALSELRTKYLNAVYDCTTVKGREAAIEGRAELRTLRTSLEKKRKQLKAPLLAMGEMIDDKAERITAEIKALEDPINAQIKADDDRREQEREAKAKAERDRIEGIHKKIRWLDGQAIVAQGKDSGAIQTILDMVSAAKIAEDIYAEFTDSAQKAKADAIERLNTMLEGARAQEAEAARVREERAELARQRKEQERIDGIKERIGELRGGLQVVARYNCTSEQIGQYIADLEAVAVTSDVYGEFYDEAVSAHFDTLQALRQAHATAKQREDEQAELQRQRDAIADQQRRLDEQRAELERQQAAAAPQPEPEAEAEAVAFFVTEVSDEPFAHPVDPDRVVERVGHDGFRPSDTDLVELVETTYGVDRDTATEWLSAFKAENVCPF